MAAPIIRPIRNCLYSRHVGCSRRHSYQPVSRALVGAHACILPKCNKFQSAIQWFHIKQYFGCICTKNQLYTVRFRLQDTRIEVHD